MSGLSAASLLLVFASSAALAHHSVPANAHSAAAQAAEKVVDRFHEALKADNRATVLALLDDKVLILESGEAERSKAEYAAHHLAADIEFTKVADEKIANRTVEATSEVAYVVSEGRTTGQYHGRKIDKLTAETMVLRRSGGSWKIVHIHWSSGNPR